MVQMNTESKIILDEEEYSTLILDNWEWKKNWLLSNQIYTSMTK
jgi:hypothetical protein